MGPEFGLNSVPQKGIPRYAPGGGDYSSYLNFESGKGALFNMLECYL